MTKTKIGMEVSSLKFCKTLKIIRSYPSFLSAWKYESNARITAFHGRKFQSDFQLAAQLFHNIKPHTCASSKTLPIAPCITSLCHPPQFMRRNANPIVFHRNFPGLGTDAYVTARTVFRTVNQKLF